MISASTLFLVTLAINVASVFGAPIRIPDASSSVAARAEVPAPAVQPVARAAVVEVGRRSRFSQPRARLAKESDLFDEVVAREPEPQLEQRADEPIMRRYPRRALHDFYEKREPATTVKETTVVVTKHITHDTPADASAYYSSHHGAGGYQPPTDGYHPPAGGYQPPAGGYYPPAGGYQYPPPVAGGHVTTLIDITQTITSAASTTTSSTATATTTETTSTATATTTSSTASATTTTETTSTATATTTETTSTATATTTETTSTATATATTTESASIATVTPAPPAAPPAANYPAAAGDVKVDYPTGDKKDIVPPAAGAPTGDKKDVPPAVDAAGDKKVVPSTADDATPAGFTTPVKRYEQYKPSTVSTLIGRQIGVSGAAMASAVRRGLALDLSIH